MALNRRNGRRVGSSNSTQSENWDKRKNAPISLAGSLAQQQITKPHIIERGTVPFSRKVYKIFKHI